MIFSLEQQLNNMLQLVLSILPLLKIGILAVLLVRIRWRLFEKLVAVFNPYIWAGMMIVKWFWREPARFKHA